MCCNGTHWKALNKCMYPISIFYQMHNVLEPAIRNAKCQATAKNHQDLYSNAWMRHNELNGPFVVITLDVGCLCSLFIVHRNRLNLSHYMYNVLTYKRLSHCILFTYMFIVHRSASAKSAQKMVSEAKVNAFAGWIIIWFQLKWIKLQRLFMFNVQCAPP